VDAEQISNIIGVTLLTIQKWKVLLDKIMETETWLMQMTKLCYLQEKEILATTWGSKICLLKDGILIQNG
jgi:hypothetical protein